MLEWEGMSEEAKSISFRDIFVNAAKNNNYYVTATINGKDSSFILADGNTSSGAIHDAITVYGYADSTKKKFIWFEIDKKAVGTYKWNQMASLITPLIMVWMLIQVLRRQTLLLLLI